MSIVFSKSELLKGVEIVEKSISAKATMPILNNFLIEIDKDRAKLISSDLESGIRTYVKVKSDDNCSVTIPCKKFSSMIKELDSKNDIVIDIKDNIVKLKSGKSKVSFVGIDSKEYPVLPEIDESQCISIETSILKDMIKKVHYAVSTDDTRFQLTGIFFDITKESLTLVATDGRRMSSISRNIVNPNNIVVSSIVSIKTISQLLQILSIDGKCTIKINIANNQIGFKITEDIMLISRIIEGKYPDYKSIIPKSFVYNVSLNTKELMSSTKQVSVMLETNISSCQYLFEDNKLKVYTTGLSTGSSEVEMDIDFTKDKLEIGFNPMYILDILKNIDCDTVNFNMTDNVGSVLVGSVKDTDYINIVMPMRTI